MKYEPVKHTLGSIFNKHKCLRMLFYKLLDLLLLRAWHIKKELKILKRIVGDKLTVLDAGMGFGQYTYYMTTLSPYWQIKGVDLKDDQVDDCSRFFTKLKQNHRVSFVKADLTKFREPDTYNLIVSVDVMEHIQDDVEVFKNFYASLKTCGMLLISTPSDKGGSDVHDDDDQSFIAEHVREGYNIHDIEEKLKYAGFSKIEVRYTYGKPGSLSWKLSMKFPIILMNFSRFLLLILPVYYLVVFPFCLVLNYLDTRNHHNEGTGLLVKAWK